MGVAVAVAVAAISVMYESHCPRAHSARIKLDPGRPGMGVPMAVSGVRFAAHSLACSVQALAALGVSLRPRPRPLALRRLRFSYPLASPIPRLVLRRPVCHQPLALLYIHLT